MDRLAKLRQLLQVNNLTAILVLQPENRRYLSGFTGSSGALLITGAEAALFTDFRYLEQAAAQCPGFNIVKHGQVIWDAIAPYTAGLRTIAYEQDFVTQSQFQLLQEKFQASKFLPGGHLVEALRITKEDSELLEMQRSASLADQAFSHICTCIRPGISEQEIALELEFFLRRGGASAAAFDFIVASGPRSSLPHGVASERVVQAGDLLTLDFGAVVNGYCSDITRTLVVGQASEQQRRVYQVVLEAQTAALAAVRPGLKGKEVDKVARDIISAYGYADNFGHGLGHGVGLVVHEEPRLSPSGETVLAPGMVVTVEPGIYLPGWGGVRIEDSVVITQTGCRVLTHSDKKLLEL